MFSPDGLMSCFVFFFLQGTNQQEKNVRDVDDALVTQDTGGLPRLENICYCDGKLGIPNKNHQLKGLNLDTKNCGGFDMSYNRGLRGYLNNVG